MKNRNPKTVCIAFHAKVEKKCVGEMGRSLNTRVLKHKQNTKSGRYNQIKNSRTVLR
jgi:hypothetical protein